MHTGERAEMRGEGGASIVAMYVQNDYYNPDEYGTSFIPEYREPCGAFYGLPHSGEWQYDEPPLYVKSEVDASMPTDRPRYKADIDAEKAKEKSEDYTGELFASLRRWSGLKLMEELRFSFPMLLKGFVWTYRIQPALQRRYNMGDYITIRYKQMLNNNKPI